MQNDTSAQNNNRYCYNCHFPLPPKAVHCSSCGQKYKTGKVSFLSMLHDFFTEFFNLDSIAFRTLKDIFIPGYLTTQYFKGRHNTYAKPIRIFLIAILWFFTLFFFLKDNFAGNVENESTMDICKRNIYKSKILHDLDTISQQLSKKYPDKEVNDILQKVRSRLELPPHDSLLQDSVNIITSGLFKENGKEKLSISNEDFVHKSAEEIVNNLNEENKWKKLELKQLVKLQQNGTNNVLSFLAKKISYAFILSIPLLSFVMFLLYARKGHYFVEHFVLLLHLHTFLFFLASLFLLCKNYLPAWVGGVATLGVFIYFYKAMRNYYQQSRFKTIVKFNVLLVSWVIILAISAAITSIVSLAFF